jgi:cytochrome c biogenesis protein
MLARPIRLFANVLFAVSLFAVWGALTVIGVIVDQGKDPIAYFNEYPAPLARLILRLNLDNIYHSPEYVGIIGLILLSLGVCTFKRVIPARLPPLRAVKIAAMPLSASLTVAGDERSIRERVRRFFSSRGWQVRTSAGAGDEWVFADRHNWARRGVLIAHLGFVIIAAGTTIYWWKGFAGQTVVVTGRTITVARTGAQIHLDRFSDRFEPIRTKSGLVYQPVDYVSHVHVTGKDGVTRDATLRVNEPLALDGTLYYQASYGYAVSFVLTKDGFAMPPQQLLDGQGLPLGSGGGSIRFTRFIPTIDPATGEPSADPRPNNPAVVVTAFDGDESLGDVLVPLGKSLDLGRGYRVTPTAYTLYSGLQYRYDPGVPLVGIGAGVLMLGLCIAFYFLPARMYVQITGGGRQWNVGIAATTVKGYDVFADRFNELIADFSEGETSAGVVALQT